MLGGRREIPSPDKRLSVLVENTDAAGNTNLSSSAFPAVFLDRDGVINRDLGYVGSVARFQLFPGVKSACRRFIVVGYRIIVITNQGGIALNYYSGDDYHAVNQYMLDVFCAAGVAITDVYHCPYHPDAPNRYTCWKDWRKKPAPGMLLAAAKEHRLDLSRSLLVGDKESDMQAAAAAGITRRFFIGKNPPSGAIACRSLARVSAFCIRTLTNS